ncbi:MAG: NAD(P)/FAD-dependent oxidoreductase [Pyrinomonadaceae bacterium]|nr:NAD(P)/FAD-dependent oxidoreductase [Pyrinomonadaceae bacterium]
MKSEIRNPKSEVLIIGAGPAGSFAAEILAKNNVKVTLFDGRPQDEQKPCGGGVTSKALKKYPQLLQATGREINDLEIFAPSGRKLYLKLAEPFAIYSRSVFDDFLRDRAEKAGAEIIKEKVSLHKQESDSWILKSYGKGENFYRGDFLIAADGANSAVAKKLSGNLAKSEMEVAFGYRVPFPQNESASTVVAFLPDFAGYAWAFPRVNEISFGIATSQDAFNHEKLDEMLWRFMLGFYRQRENPKAKIWQNVNENIELKKDLSAKIEKYAARIPGLSPETLANRKTCGENWALLGDAAGFADSVTGEGIYYALRSAELFAESFLQNGDYETLWREDFGRELKRASQMRTRFYGEFFGVAFSERMIQFARFHNGIQRTLGELVAGDQGYIDLKRTLAKRALMPF